MPQPGYPASVDVDLYFNGSCLVLGCPQSGNIFGNSAATVPGAGLQTGYLDLLI